MVTVPTDQQPEVICLVVQLDILHTLTMVCVFVCVSLYIAFSLMIMLDCVSPILVLTFIFLFRNQLLILLSSVHFAEI